MAANDRRNQTSGQQPTPAQEDQAGHNYGAAGYQPNTNPDKSGQPRPMGMGNLNQLFQRSGSFNMSENRSAEALRALREVGDEAIKAQQLDSSFEVIRFDRDQHHVGLSSILVVKTVAAGGNRVVAGVRTLILDSDAIRLRPDVFYAANNQRIEIQTRPQDVFNNAYWKRLDGFIRETRGAEDMRVYDAGPLLIPSEFDFSDNLAVAQLLITSVNRCDDILGRHFGEQPLQIGSVKSPDERLSARVDFSNMPKHTITGLPVRNDIVVEMNRSANQGANQEDDYYERESTLNSVSGFVNLEYTGPQPQQQMGFAQQPGQLQPIYAPSFIITSVDQAGWLQATTPELYLLALSNAYRVTAGTQWARAFLPKMVKGNDPQDIGALGYLLPQNPTKWDTKTDSFSETDFANLMRDMVKPHPTFLIDVDPVGDKMAVEYLLEDAAYAGVNKESAKKRLVAAADALTGNRFSPKYVEANGSIPDIVVPSSNDRQTPCRVHLGYYEGPDGERHDIRELDVLAMLNLTEGNINDFNEWYATYHDLSIPLPLRLQRRENLERHYLSKGLKITGWAHRLMIEPKFLVALDQAVTEAGVHVQMEDVSAVFGGQRFTGNEIVGSYAVTQNAQLNYGNTGMGGGNQAANPHYGNTGSGRLY